MSARRKDFVSRVEVPFGYEDRCKLVTTHTLRRWLRKAKSLRNDMDNALKEYSLCDDIMHVLSERKGEK